MPRLATRSMPAVGRLPCCRRAFCQFCGRTPRAPVPLDNTRRSTRDSARGARTRSRTPRFLQGRHARPLLCHLQLLCLLLRGDAGLAQRGPHVGFLRLCKPSSPRTMYGLRHVCPFLPVWGYVGERRHSRRGFRAMHGLRSLRLPVHSRGNLTGSRPQQRRTIGNPGVRIIVREGGLAGIHRFLL
jgi:hypothetical protein